MSDILDTLGTTLFIVAIVLVELVILAAGLAAVVFGLVLVVVAIRDGIWIGIPMGVGCIAFGAYIAKSAFESEED